MRVVGIRMLAFLQSSPIVSTIEELVTGDNLRCYVRLVLPPVTQPRTRNLQNRAQSGVNIAGGRGRLRRGCVPTRGDRGGRGGRGYRGGRGSARVPDPAAISNWSFIEEGVLEQSER